MRSLATVLLSVALAPQAALAAESDFFWQQGFGMGVLESWVTSGPDNVIRHACADAALLPNTITFQLDGHGPSDQRVFLDFGYGPEDVHAPGGEIISDNRSGAMNYDWVMERLKRHEQVRVSFSSGESADFTLRGSSAALGDCIATFWQ